MSKPLDLREMLRVACAVCRRAGYPMSDPEYESSANWAVYRAQKDWTPEGGRSPTSLAARYALQACRRLRLRMRQLRRGDLAGASRGRAEPPTPTPIPLADFEVLSFVAAHGRSRSAVLLGMSRTRLRDLLDEIFLRVRPE